MKKIEEYTRGWNAALKATAEFANRNLNQEVSQPEEEFIYKNNIAEEADKLIGKNKKKGKLPEPVMRVAPKPSENDIELVFEKCR